MCMSLQLMRPGIGQNASCAMCDIIFPYIKAYLLYIFTAKGVVVHHVGAYCIIIVMMAVCSHLH